MPTVYPKRTYVRIYNICRQYIQREPTYVYIIYADSISKESLRTYIYISPTVYPKRAYVRIYNICRQYIQRELYTYISLTVYPKRATYLYIPDSPLLVPSGNSAVDPCIIIPDRPAVARPCLVGPGVLNATNGPHQAVCVWRPS